MDTRKVLVTIAIIALHIAMVSSFHVDFAATMPPCTLPNNTCSTPPSNSHGPIVPESTVSCGMTITGNTTGGQDNGGLGTCGAEPGQSGLWYIIVIEEIEVTEYELKIEIYDDAGCGGGSPSCIMGQPGRVIIITENLKRRYYLRITGIRESAGFFRLRILCD